MRAWLGGVKDRGFMILLEEEDRPWRREAVRQAGFDVHEAAASRGARLWEIRRRPLRSRRGAMSTLAVEADGLGRRYGRRWALVDVTSRAPAARVMVAGRNGSGKSTLLRVIATAIRPTRGRRASRASMSCPAATPCAAGPRCSPTRPTRTTRSPRSRTWASPRASSAGPPPRSRCARCSRRSGSRSAPTMPSRPSRRDAQAAGARARPSAGRRGGAARRALRPARPAGVPAGGPASRAPARAGRTVLMATHLLERGADLCDAVSCSRRGAWPGRGPRPTCPRRRPGREGSARLSLRAALGKDALLQWRTRARFLAVLAFGAVALLLFSFALGPGRRSAAPARAGLPVAGNDAGLDPRARGQLPEPSWSSARSRAAAAAGGRAGPLSTARRSRMRPSSLSWAWLWSR